MSAVNKTQNQALSLASQSQRDLETQQGIWGRFKSGGVNARSATDSVGRIHQDRNKANELIALTDIRNTTGQVIAALNAECAEKAGALIVYVNQVTDAGQTTLSNLGLSQAIGHERTMMENVGLLERELLAGHISSEGANEIANLALQLKKDDTARAIRLMNLGKNSLEVMSEETIAAIGRAVPGLSHK